MSFFISTPKTPPTGFKWMLFAASYGRGDPMCVPLPEGADVSNPDVHVTIMPTVNVSSQMDIPISTDTLPPVGLANDAPAYRYYLYPIDPANNRYGIFTQQHGRTQWLTMIQHPGNTVWLIYTENANPPSGTHPAVWVIGTSTPFGMENWKTLYNPYYGKYLATRETDQEFTSTTSVTNDCKFDFIWKSGTGPVVPTPFGQVSLPGAQFFVISQKYGKALKSSVTPPYLTLATVDYTDDSQKFFFRPQLLPDLFHQSIPYTYNMFFVTNPDTMLCFEDTTTLSIRDGEPGAWEQLILWGYEPVYNPAIFPNFKIMSFEFMSLLRANADNSVDLVDSNAVETDKNWFYLIPVGRGIPYPDGATPSTGKAKSKCCCSIS